MSVRWGDDTNSNNIIDHIKKIVSAIMHFTR